MAKRNRRPSRELRLLQEDSCFEETKNVKRSEFKCNDCSLSFHRKTSYDSHVMINHKKKDEMSEIWNQLDKAEEARIKPRPSEPNKIQIIKSNLKNKMVVGLDGKVHKKYQTGIVELRKKVKESNVTDAMKSSNVRLASPSTSAQKPTLLPRGTTSKFAVFDKKGIECLICKHYFRNCFEFGVHTTRVQHRIPCQICFQYFDNQCHLKRHERIAHPHICNMCDKLFSTEQHLEIHRRVSHRLIFHTMTVDNPKQNQIKFSSTTAGSKAISASGVSRGANTSFVSGKGGPSKSHQLTTIVISDSDSDELTKTTNQNTSQKLTAASVSDLGPESLTNKHKLSAKDMMQNLATIAKSKDNKDPFSSMLSVMLEKPPVKKGPSVIYTTARPVVNMQVSLKPGKSILGTTVPSSSVNKPVQSAQNKVVNLKSQVATTTGLSSFLGQHVTSTVYSNLRPKGSFNLGKQVERVNLACRLAQHKQSLELKRLLKRHPQYNISDKDLKFKIPLGNLNEEFDDCPLFPREEDVKIRTSDYTLSPLSVIDDKNYLENFGLNTNVMQRMFSEAVDSCLLQEAWKLTHSTNLRKRCREVTSYSLKQKQECILDLHVQLLAIRNAAQTIVNNALVKHITELKQAGKQSTHMTQVQINQQGNIQLVGQVLQNEISTQKHATQSDNGNAMDQNSKDLYLKGNEVNGMNETKQTVTCQANTQGQSSGKECEAAAKCEDKQSKVDTAKEEEKINPNLNVCNEIHGPNPVTDQPNTQQHKESAQITHQISRDDKHALTNPKEDLYDPHKSKTVKDMESSTCTNGIDNKVEDLKEVNVNKYSGDEVVDKSDIFKHLCNKHTDTDQVLSDGESKPNKNLEVQAVNEVDVNKTSENQMPINPSKNIDNPIDTEILIDNKPGLVHIATGDKTDTKGEQKNEMEKIDRLQALTIELVKAIPASKSGENIYISEVQISSEYCGLIGKGHYNGMDFRWIVQFARPYVNTLLTYRNPEWREGFEGETQNDNVIESTSNETHPAVSSKSIITNPSIVTSVSSSESQSNIPSVSQASTFAGQNITSVFNSEATTLISQHKEVVATTVTTHVSALPSLKAFPLNIVQQHLATAPVGLSQPSVAIPSSSPVSPVAVPIHSPKSANATPVIFGKSSMGTALVQVLPVQRSAQPALVTFSSMVPAAQPISTNIFLSPGAHQLQNSVINEFPTKVNLISSSQTQNEINLSSRSTLSQNSNVCVQTMVGQTATAEAPPITNIAFKTVGQIDRRPLLPKVCQPNSGLLALPNNNVAVLHQDVLLKSAGFNQQQIYTFRATNPVASNFNSVPTTQDSNQLPSEGKACMVPMYIDANIVVEEPTKKFFYRFNDCLEFEAGELTLFNNDIQNCKVPRLQNKKLFRCEVGGGQGGVQQMVDNRTFLNSLYSIKKMYITGHLSKTVYQKLIPIARILICPRITLCEKRKLTFLVESSLKQSHRKSEEDLDKVSDMLLDVLKKYSKKPKDVTGQDKKTSNESKSERPSDTELSEFKRKVSSERNTATKVNIAEEIKGCGLRVCLTDLKLPTNQSTFLLTEDKNVKNEHVGFMIKSKTGKVLKRNVGFLTQQHSTNMGSHAGSKKELTKKIKYDDSIKYVVVDEIEKGKGFKEEPEMSIIKKKRQMHNKSNDAKQLRGRKHSIKRETRQRSKLNVCRNNKEKVTDLFVIPDETDPEIEFASPSPKRKKINKRK
ncbi:uncharacterized protein LOC117114171 [Anneissia japonica]|uniref:uncharacterized protein LOC117114171 n=1 Tax=Anneissia japonica TaxID=1529436 RepID=UPI0014257E0B|nr:uncharacterized protein LOC117114171 [Anneissia japonica]